jgi:hypothetical protein
MDEATLIALVRLAINCHETKWCLEYITNDLEERIRSNQTLQPIGTPAAIKKLLVQYVLTQNGRIEIRRETREEYQDRREFWFRVRVPIDGYARPLFFELELTDDDPDLPSAMILNVHF